MDQLAFDLDRSLEIDDYGAELGGGAFPDEVAPDFEETCPHCDADFLLEAFDVFRSPNGERRLEWRGCCEYAAHEVELYGVESLLGVTWERLVEIACGGEAPQRVEAGQVLQRGREVELAESDGLVVYKARCGVVRGSEQGGVFAVIDEHHRHHDAPQGWKFGARAMRGDVEVGVAVVGRPVSRTLQKAEPKTLEVTRVCVYGDRRLKRDVSSALYRACADEVRRMGFDSLITYTLVEESGASLRAAGFVEEKETKGGTWDRPSRRRTDKAPTGKKKRWRLQLTKGKASK